MSTPQAPTGRPIVDFASRLHTVLDRLGDAPAWSMTQAEQRSVLVELDRGQARVEELRLRVLAAGDRADIAADSAATSTGAWLAHATRTLRSTAHADVRLASALDEAFAATREALAAGHVNADQTRVIVSAVQALPEAAVAADPSLTGRAEKHLLALAGEYDARALRNLGRHLFEVLDPDAADVELGKKLEAEEQAAARKRFLELHDNGDGTHSGRFKIDSLHAAIFRKALEAFTQPAHRHHAGLAQDAVAPRRTRPEQLGQAFCELIERLDPAGLPSSGGVNATVVVMLDFDQLLTGLGTARLDTGEQISAALARRLACGAGVIPAVYRRLVDGRSVVLDMGRRRRLFTEAQRIALDIEQGGCTTEGCDRPAGWCHAHHDELWSEGGPTNVKTARLLCPYHHRKAHSTAYRMEHLPDGKVRFHRRP